MRDGPGKLTQKKAQRDKGINCAKHVGQTERLEHMFNSKHGGKKKSGGSYRKEIFEKILAERFSRLKKR